MSKKKHETEDKIINDDSKPKAEADQRALDLGNEYTDGDGDGMGGDA